MGVDVSKSTLDIVIVSEGAEMLHAQIPNQLKTIRKFFAQSKKSLSMTTDRMTVCLEHTGIYGFALLEALQQMKVKICVEPALQIKQSQGMTRGKNDKVDAKRIAQYAFKNRLNLRLWKPQRPVLQRLQALLSLRDRLVKVKVQLETPIQEVTGYIEADIAKSLQSSSKAAIKGVERDLHRVEKEIDDLVRSDDNLKTQFTRATSVPGVGKITGLYMIVSSGEFERINDPKKFACYSGVAPFEHQSGSSIRGRTRVSRMANMTMKKLLHLAALSAIQCCQEIRDYYLRKVAQGKNKMAVINAVRNKLITRVYACVKHQRLYEKTLSTALA